MHTLQKKLQQREKSELIALIEHMLRQEPDLQWLVTTPLPVASSQKASIDPKLYQQQVLAVLAAEDYRRKPKRDEVQQRLTAIKSIADEYVAYEDYTAALTIYEVLVSEVIEHFNTYRDEYVAFCVILSGCIDGLDSCFAIYRFYTDSGMDLDDDIPGLLVGNTTPEERQIIAGWVQDALAHMPGWNSSQPYETLLAAFEKENKRS
jgi:hypothetical protein